jgi:hypothetical protein
MKEYEVEINGVPHTLLLDEEDAKRYPDAKPKGSAASKAPAAPKAPKA